MLMTRLIPVLIVGSLTMSSAFAGDTSATPATTALTKEQISAIEKECSKNNGGSMSSQAYKNCVKAKEDAAIAEANHKK